MHLFNKENIQIESSSFPHTFCHPDKKYNSANRIICSRRGEERFQYIYSDLQTSINSRALARILQCFHMQSSHPMLGNYSTYRINSSTRILQENIQLQGPSHAGRYKASSSICSPCIQAFYMAETLLVTL